MKAHVRRGLSLLCVAVAAAGEFIWRAVHFHLRPARASSACHVDGLHAAIGKDFGGLFREAPAHLFCDDGYFEFLADFFDLLGETGEVHITGILHGFLQWIQMKDQRVGLDHVHGLAALVNAVAVVELYGSEIGE